MAGTVQSSVKEESFKPQVAQPPIDRSAERIVSEAIDKGLNSSATGPNFVNVNVPQANPSINMQVNPNITFSFDFNNYSFNSIFQYTNKIKSMVTDRVDEVKTRITDRFLSSCVWLIEHKKSICFACVLGIYSAFQWRIHCLERLLKRRRNWSLHTACIRDIPCDEFLEGDEHRCCAIEVDIDQLIIAIQRRYIGKENVFDCVKPLAVFMDAIDEELELLRQYRGLIRTFRKVYLSTVLWYSTELFKSVPSRLARLIAIKSSFIRWLAECKQEALHTVLKRKQRMDFGIRFILRS